MSKRIPPLSIKGVVFRAQNDRSEVLLLQNERREWELPGGRMEHNETPEACLVREFKEETGLEVKVGPCVHKGVLTIAPPYVPSATTVCVWAYGCHLNQNSASVDQNVVISGEHQAWRWIPVADVSAMLDTPDLYKSCILSWAQRFQL